MKWFWRAAALWFLFLSWGSDHAHEWVTIAIVCIVASSLHERLDDLER